MYVSRGLLSAQPQTYNTTTILNLSNDGPISSVAARGGVEVGAPGAIVGAYDAAAVGAPGGIVVGASGGTEVGVPGHRSSWGRTARP